MAILTNVYSHWPKFIYVDRRLFIVSKKIWKDNIDIEIPKNGYIDQSLFTLTGVYSEYLKNMGR